MTNDLNNPKIDVDAIMAQLRHSDGRATEREAAPKRQASRKPTDPCTDPMIAQVRFNQSLLQAVEAVAVRLKDLEARFLVLENRLNLGTLRFDLMSTSSAATPRTTVSRPDPDENRQLDKNACATIDALTLSEKKLSLLEEHIERLSSCAADNVHEADTNREWRGALEADVTELAGQMLECTRRQKLMERQLAQQNEKLARLTADSLPSTHTDGRSNG